MRHIKRLGDADQRGVKRQQAEPLPHHQIFRRRRVGLAKVVQRSAVQEVEVVVLSLAGTDHERRRHHRVLGMQQHRLLGGQVPGFVEA